MKAVFDTRALAVSRVGFALTLLLSLLEWSLDFQVFLAPKGVLPLEALVADTPYGQIGWSLYHALPSTWTTAALLLATAVGAILLAAGWRLRITAPLVFLATLSLHNRCAWALEESDALLLLGLFALVWLCQTEPWTSSWFYLVFTGSVWAADIALNWEQLGLAMRLGCLVAPLLVVWCRNSYQRHTVVAVVAGLFVLIHPAEWRTLLVFGCWVAGWLWFGKVPSPTNNEEQAAWVALALLFLMFLVAPQNSARFWALGPRAQVVSQDVWFVLVGLTPEGERRDLDTGKEPTFEFSEERFLRSSHRRRLFLGTLARGEQPELAYWLGLSFLRRERAEGIATVEVYRCRKGEKPQQIGVWPLQRY